MWCLSNYYDNTREEYLDFLPLSKTIVTAQDPTHNLGSLKTFKLKIKQLFLKSSNIAFINYDLAERYLTPDLN